MTKPRIATTGKKAPVTVLVVSCSRVRDSLEWRQGATRSDQMHLALEEPLDFRALAPLLAARFEARHSDRAVETVAFYRGSIDVLGAPGDRESYLRAVEERRAALLFTSPNLLAAPAARSTARLYRLDADSRAEGATPTRREFHAKNRTALVAWLAALSGETATVALILVDCNDPFGREVVFRAARRGARFQSANTPGSAIAAMSAAVAGEVLEGLGQVGAAARLADLTRAGRVGRAIALVVVAGGGVMVEPLE